MLALLHLVLVCPVEPGGGEDGIWRPLMVVRGSWGARTARDGGIGCRQVAVLVGSRFGWTEGKNWRFRIASEKV